MAFITLTQFETNIRVAINTDNIDFVLSNAARSKVNFASGTHLHVNESFDEVQALLPGYVAPVAIVEEAVSDEAPTPGEHAAANGAAADAAHPAKSRQTK